LTPDGIIFQIIPYSLIRVQFRRIGGKKEKSKAILQGLYKPFFDFRFVRRMSIKNQSD